MQLHFQDFGFPVEVELVHVKDGILTEGFLSTTENVRYLLQAKIDINKDIAIGNAPYGNVAIWHESPKKKILKGLFEARALPNQQSEEADETLSPNCFHKLMRQYCYRYCPEGKNWDEKEGKWVPLKEDDIKVELTGLVEALWDGTFDKLNDGSLMKYHMAGKPKRLALGWSQGKSQYSAYMWLDEDAIRETFERFYGAHPETKTDLIIRFSPDGARYELAMFRFGLKEPVVIKDDTYQVIAFKNGFEHYRSPNYSQPRGAWLW